MLNEAKLATLLIDLLTEEEAIDLRTAHLRFDIGLLAERLDRRHRLAHAAHPDTRPAGVGYFGASTGAGAALVAAAERPRRRRRGRLARRAPGPGRSRRWPRVRAPTLLIVGGNDRPGHRAEPEALAQLRCEKQLVIVPGQRTCSRSPAPWMRSPPWRATGKMKKKGEVKRRLEKGGED